MPPDKRPYHEQGGALGITDGVGASLRLSVKQSAASCLGDLVVGSADCRLVIVACGAERA
jgi:hypothetical protein